MNVIPTSEREEKSAAARYGFLAFGSE